jgi:hypothetical protein
MYNIYIEQACVYVCVSLAAPIWLGWYGAPVRLVLLVHAACLCMICKAVRCVRLHVWRASVIAPAAARAQL